jgi:hypothetical protein
MRTQLIRNSGWAAMLQLAGRVAALLIVLGSVATAGASTLSEIAPARPLAEVPLAWSGIEVTVRAGLVASAHSSELDFGTAGLTVMGPFAAADGESSGMVLGWIPTARDPAYLFTATSLFSTGVGGWNSSDEITLALPNLGVVPGGNLSVFDTGAVDVISWNFLEISCALLALRVDDYLRLKSVLEPGDFDLDARAPGFDEQVRAVPDPATSLLMGQGLLVLALIGRISRRAP